MGFAISSFIANAIAAPEFLMGLVITAFLVLFIPWKSNFKPLNALLNSADDRKDPLAKSWREQKLGELTFVGVACAIVASIVTGAIAWPQDPSTPALPWITRASWYSSLILGLTAVSSATQQSLTLYRLGCYEDCLSRLRHILGREHRRKDGSTFWTVRWTQMVVWQIPVMLLNFSILLFVFGLLALLRAKAIQAGDQLSHDDVKIVILVGSFAGFAFISYLLGMLLLYYQIFQNAT